MAPSSSSEALITDPAAAEDPVAPVDPASPGAVPASYGFLARQLGLLGDRDPLAVLAETPAVLAGFVEGREPDDLRRQLVPGKWTPNQLLGHLADTEWIFGFRTRTILCDPEPTLQGVDQDLWVGRQPVNEGEPRRHVERFTALREINLELWRSLSPDELARVGHHADAGVPMSIALLHRILAGHDLSHREHLEHQLSLLDG